MTDASRHDLVNRNARMNIRRAFFQPHACQKRAIGAGVIAAPVVTRQGGAVIQLSQHLYLPPEIGQRREGPAELIIRAGCFGPPFVGNCSIRKVKERRAQGRAARSGRQFIRDSQGLGRAQRRKRRQRDTCAQSAEKLASIK